MKAVDILKKYDFSFFLIATAIFIVGIVNLYSATSASSELGQLVKKQLFFYAISLVVGFAISFIRPKNIYQISYYIYFFNIFLLLAVLLVGVREMGAQRWLVFGALRMQPSEFMKVSLVLALSKWFSDRDPFEEMGLKNLLIPGLLTLVPMLLIIVEPDLGTGIIILLIFAFIVFYRRLKWKTMLILALLCVASSVLIYSYGLKDYQKRRITNFIRPDEDSKGSGYNAIQSKIAIGSGRILGKGFLKSSQASFNYLPENHTDFVFSIFNEEHGLMGSLFLIGLYLLLIFRYIRLSMGVLKVHQSITAIGLVSILFCHVFINMAMVTGFLPIVGLPLPLMSYGGSSLLTFAICNGLATSISNNRSFF